jgi:hypothetical protein
MTAHLKGNVDENICFATLCMVSIWLDNRSGMPVRDGFLVHSVVLKGSVS